MYREQKSEAGFEDIITVEMPINGILIRLKQIFNNKLYFFEKWYRGKVFKYNKTNKNVSRLRMCLQQLQPEQIYNVM